MIDLESFIGKFVWQEITLNGSNFVVPDVEYICRFIMLLLVVYFLIRGIFSILKIFS